MAIANVKGFAGLDEIHSADAIEVHAAQEEMPGVLHSTPSSRYWRELEVNSFSSHSIKVETIARDYLNKNRVQGKPKIQKDMAEAGWQADVTDDVFPRFARGFLFSDDGLTANQPDGSKSDTQSVYKEAPTDVGTITATNIALSNTAAGLGTRAFGVGNIIKIHDREQGGNDGKVVPLITGTAAATLTAAADSFVAQAASAAAAPNIPDIRIASVGQQFTSATVSMAVENGKAVLTRTAGDFTTLGLTPGEYIVIGGDVAESRFREPVNGFARIESVAALKIVLTDTGFSPGVGNGLAIAADPSATPPILASPARTVEIYWGDFISNGNTKRTWQVERVLGRRASDKAGQSDVIVGCLPNELTINFENEGLVNVDLNFMPLIGGTTAFGDTLCSDIAGSFKVPSQDWSGYSTQADLHRAKLTVLDSSVGDLFSFVESANLTISNNVTGRSALGHRGYIAQNARKFTVTGDMTAVFETTAVLQAIQDNLTCSLDVITIARDTRHAIVYHIPQLTLAGEITAERDEDILVSLTPTAFMGRGEDFVVGMTVFQHVPSFLDNL